MSSIARDYTVVLTPENGAGFVVTVPALPEVSVRGATVDESLAKVEEAIELALNVRRDEGDSIPPDAAPTVMRVHVVIDQARPRLQT